MQKLKIYVSEYHKVLQLSYLKRENDKELPHKLRMVSHHNTKEEIYDWFANILVRRLRLAAIPVDLTQGEDPEADKILCEGNLPKKSKYLNNWSLRRMVATDRIESFRGNKCTLEIRGVKEFGTVFELIDGSLVVKLRHGHEKTEIGVPIVNFPVRYCRLNWLYRIYRMMSIKE